MFRAAFILVASVLALHTWTLGQDAAKADTPQNGSDGNISSSFGLVIDNSGSYRLLLEKVILLTEDLIEQKSAEDEAFLVTFVDGTKIKLRQEFTTSNEDLRDSAQNMYIEGGPTAILDALKYAVDYFNENSKNGSRKFLVLVTDGDERSSAARFEDVEKIVRERGLKIYVVGLAEGKVSLKLIEKLVKATGGKLYLPRTREEISAAARQLWADVREK